MKGFCYMKRLTMSRGVGVWTVYIYTMLQLGGLFRFLTLFLPNLIQIALNF